MIIHQNDVVTTTQSPKRIVKSTLLLLIILTTLTPSTQSRDLRPSDHGLPYQLLPPQSPQTSLFFGDTASKTNKPSPPAPTHPPQLGDAAEDEWGSESPKKREDIKARKALIVATVICGGAGVVLLCTAAILFGIHFWKKKRLPKNSSTTTTAVVVNNNSDNRMRSSNSVTAK